MRLKEKKTTRASGRSTARPIGPCEPPTGPLVLNKIPYPPVSSYGIVQASVIKALGLSSFVGNDKYADIVCAHPGDIHRKARIFICFWDASLLPDGYAEIINESYKEVWVTSDFTVKAFKDSGVTLPIRKFPLAVDYQPLALPPLSPLTFINVSSEHNVTRRKRIQDIADAFSAEFKSESDVRLILKRSPHCRRINTFDSRIEIIAADIPDVRPLYARAHCGVFCSGMEGWGLPAHELMALGRPSILPLAFGFKEFCTPATSFPAVYSYKPVPQEVYNGKGIAPFVDIADLRKSLRYVYENRDELIIKAGECVKQARKFRFPQMQARLWQILSLRKTI